MSKPGQLIAQVVPDLPTFAVDDGFAYRIPAPMENLQVGSMVRVPLGSRRVRGYVTSVRTGDPSGLKPIVSVSGDLPVFDKPLLQSLRWAALHYVAPMAVLLGRAAPPNLPRGKGSQPHAPIPETTSPLDVVSRDVAAGRHPRPTSLVTGSDYSEIVTGLANAPLHAGRNVALVAPTIEEAARFTGNLAETYGDRVIPAWSGLPARDVTRSWVTSQRAGGVLVVGTLEVLLWPLGDLGLWIVTEEGRRAMKAKSTPTLQVHEVVRRRSLVERSGVVFVGPVPTVDVLSRGAAIVEPPGRTWPLVEIVDRRDSPPGGRSVEPRTMQAIAATMRSGGQVFVFVSRRGYAPAFRCIRCRELRRCPECGAGPDRGDSCRRCGARLGPCRQCGGRRFEPLGAGIGRVTEQLSRYLGEQHVGPVGSGMQVLVGSERDLTRIPPTAMSVAIDADSLLMAPNYRAEEDALRLLARVALTVARGRGRRCLVQSAQPTHRVLLALTTGHPVGLLGELGRERVRDSLPPTGELLAVEVTGDAAATTQDIAELDDESVDVHGPETGGGRTRWFLQGSSLQSAKVRLRPLVQKWRDAGLKVRLDADPIDL